MKYDDMKHVLAAADHGSYELDAKLWSLYHQHGNPMPHYAEEWFEEARSEGQAAARLSTNMSAVLELLEDKLPDADLEIVSDEDGITVTVSGEKDGEEIRETCQARVPLTKMALVLGQAAFGAMHQQDKIVQRGYTAEWCAS